MSDAPQSRVLAIMGSGETSPTMVTIHKALVAGLGQGSHSAVLLDTPYAFQENAADISARSQAYFARSVGLRASVLSEVSLPADQAKDHDQSQAQDSASAAAIRAADWVFAGPGSPSYALSRWRGTQIASALRDRIAAGTGVTVIASAAAAAIGFRAVPVYEIYKVGSAPHWLDGLNLLSALGLKVAVIPHYDNAEGGTHDTRFCYLGERRLAVLERELPADSAVLGVDEHTALIFDLLTQEARVVGRGGATVRKAGVSTVLPSGSRVTLPDLRSWVRSGTPASGFGQAAPPQAEAGQNGIVQRAGGGSPAGRTPAGERILGGEFTPAGDGQEAQALPDITVDADGRFEAAARERNGAEMVSAILDLEGAIEAWSTDTDQNDNSELARAVLRGLVVRLGRAAEQGLTDPADRLRPAVEPLIALRDTLRKDGSYAAADVIRDALTAAGIEVKDSPDGTKWALNDSPSTVPPRQPESILDDSRDTAP